MLPSHSYWGRYDEREKFVISIVSGVLLFSSVGPTFAETKNSSVVDEAVISTMLSNDFISEQARLGNPIYEELDKVKAQPQATLKLVSYALRVGGWALEQLLKPFSKTAASAVKKHRTKIADVLEEIETVSEMALTQQFRKFMPKKAAEAAAKILVWILL